VNSSDDRSYPVSLVYHDHGSNLASGRAETAPPPTVLGGSCTFGDEAARSTANVVSGSKRSSRQPAPGTHVVEVAAATAQQSDPS
jgi:hypothetical protein